MSLLIDALKKAEQEKKNADKQLQGDIKETTDSPPLNQAQQQDADISGGQALSINKAETDNKDTESLSLLSMDEDPAKDGDIKAESQAREVVESLPKEKPIDAIVGGEDTHVPSEYQYFGTTVSSKDLARDIGRTSPTPVSARTVFAAGIHKPKNIFSILSILVGICLTVLTSLWFLVFKYTWLTELSIKSSSLADTTQTKPKFLIAGLQELESVAQNLPDAMLTDDEVSTDRQKIADITGGKTTVDIIRNDNQGMETPVKLPELPEKIEVQSELIKISRSKSDDNISSLVTEAYRKYLAGNYDSAERDYRQVLERSSSNHDALSGLALLAEKKGNIHQAYSYYLDILQHYPEDSIAEASLINLQIHSDQISDEPTLKVLAQKHPEQAFLHYSLGNLYAGQQRWPEAQQSFFNAYNSQPSSPDYAYNLAVSLDHLDQSQAALNYYKEALVLANQAGKNFDEDIVSSRIAILSSMIAPN